MIVTVPLSLEEEIKLSSLIILKILSNILFTPVLKVLKQEFITEVKVQSLTTLALKLFYLNMLNTLLMSLQYWLLQFLMEIQSTFMV